jgi:hypothetical protein
LRLASRSGTASRRSEVLLALACLVLAACASGSGEASGGLVEDLDLSGAVSGHVTSASLAGSCGVPANLGQAYTTQLVGKVAGSDFSYYVEVRTWQGAGDYPATITDNLGNRFPSVTVTVGKRTFTSLEGSGKLTVDGGAKTGRVDMMLTEGGTAGAPSERIAGRWRCG